MGARPIFSIYHEGRKMLKIDSVTVNDSEEFGIIELGDTVEVAGSWNFPTTPKLKVILKGKGKKGTDGGENEITLEQADITIVTNPDGTFTVTFNVPFGQSGEDNYRVTVKIEEDIADGTGHSWSKTFVVKDPLS